ncbi:condensation domain protein [Mycobacterium kansasii 732]|nr:condensation domain protein [Mycobacterium kansasii 732]
MQSIDPSSSLLNVCASYRLTGTVDVGRLHRALDAVAVRHPVLRTTYHADDDGDPCPVVHDDLRPGWAHHDLSGLAEQARQLRLEVLAQRQFRRPFDLATDSPLRVTAVRLGADELTLLITAHRIAWDDGSWGPFFTDLTRAYADRDGLDGATPAGVGRYRRNPRRGSGLLAIVDGGPARAAGTSGCQRFSGAQHLASATGVAQLSADTVDRVTALAGECEATPYLVMLAAFAALIHRYTHATDFLIAAPVTDRNGGAENAIGYYGNTVVVRARRSRGKPSVTCWPRPATSPPGLSPTSASTSTGWCGSPTPTAATVPTG